MTWREKQLSKPDVIAAALAAYHRARDDGRTEYDAMVAAIDAHEDALAVWRECDEPGCNRVASCGWPTGDGGYRCTCYEHAEGLRK